MKPSQIAFIMFPIALVISYLSGSFYNANFNIIAWSSVSRLLILLLFFSLWLIPTIVTYLNPPSHK